jgi:hypothetical protein
MDKKNITATNRMSGTRLVEKYGKLKFIENKKTGKIFFSVGDISGYVSPKVQAKLDTITLDEIEYAEISIDGKKAVPTLMMENKANVLRTLE